MTDNIRSYIQILLFGSLLIFSGCGSDSGRQESSQDVFPTVNMTGAWKGTATTQAAGALENITLVLEQVGASVSGSYACADGTIACARPEGTFSARVVKSNFTGGVVFTNTIPSGPSCSLHGSISGDTLTAELLCNPSSREDQVEWNLTRQG